MTRKHWTWKTAHQKEFVKVFESVDYSKSPWSVWRDFIYLLASGLANSKEPDIDIAQKRADRSHEIVARYNDTAIEKLYKLAEITTEALNQNADQDFLGELYMGLGFGNSSRDQFFTPWHVAKLMAKMTINPLHDEVRKKGFITVNDPTCGSGCMLLATRAAYLETKHDPVNDILYVGQDIDEVAALMCYIQLSILGCAGYVAIGDSLSNPIVGTVLWPTIGEGGQIWFTPRWNSQIWQHRRICNVMELAFSDAGKEKNV